MHSMLTLAILLPAHRSAARARAERRWEEQTAALVEQHGRVVEEVKAGYEARLQQQEEHHVQLQQVGGARDWLGAVEFASWLAPLITFPQRPGCSLGRSRKAL